MEEKHQDNFSLDFMPMPVRTSRICGKVAPLILTMELETARMARVSFWADRVDLLVGTHSMSTNHIHQSLSLALIHEHQLSACVVNVYILSTKNCCYREIRIFLKSI